MKQITNRRASRLQASLLGALAVVLAGAPAADAQTAPVPPDEPALNVRYGDPAPSLAADVDAMGWTGVALYRGGFSNVLNPACLAAEGGHRADASVELRQIHEDRFQPLYDQFSSYVADIGIASSRNHFYGSGFALSSRVPLGPKPLGAGLSLTERYTFDYGFSEQILEPDPGASNRDAPLEDRSVDISGALHDLSGGLGIALTPRISLGLAAHYGFGTSDQVTKRRNYQTADSSLFAESTFEMEGLNFTFGALIHASDRLDFGFAYDSPMSVTGDTEIETTRGAAPDTVMRSTAGVDYPRSYRAGFAYRPRSAPRTVFTVDATLTKWTEIKDSRITSVKNPLIRQDTWDVRFGLEHLFYNRLPVRFGFRHLDSYEDREAGTSFFTAGVGLMAAGGMFNVSTELSKTMSIRPHWFRYPTGSSATPIGTIVPIVAGDLARVETTAFRVAVGFTRDF